MTRNTQQVIHALRIARSTARVAWIGATIALLAIIVLPHVLPAVGRQMYVVRGASMEPAIPIGSVVIVRNVQPGEVRVGEVVTFRLPQGTVVTHRVTGITADGLSFLTKGDASAAPDPVPVPASSLVGGLELSVPGLGSVIAGLSSTAGQVMILGFLGGLLLASWFLDELLVTVHRSAQRRMVASAAG